MTQFWAMFKKENISFIRTYKLLIFCSVFLLLAFLSPLSAKFMPEILSNFLPKEVADSFPEPTAFSSWEQFFKNFSQIGLFIIVLLFAPILSAERQNGTLIILFSKGLSRSAVVMSKWLFAAFMWTIGYVISFAIVYFYTEFYWPANDVTQLFLAIFTLWLFGIFLISVIIFANVLFRSYFSTLLFTLGIIILLFIVAIFPKLEKISILRLATENNAILQNLFTWQDYTVLMSVTSGLSIILVLLAVIIFNKKTV